MGEDVSVIIPAYNESDCILRTLKGLKGIESIKEIIVVDDGSTDSTYQILKPLGDIILLRNKYNEGKGSAVRHALNYATNSFVCSFRRRYL
jgi:glycosyltransferase involved in cell wall biosynthesis